MQVRKLKRGRILLTGALAGSMLLHLLYGMESIKQYEAFEYQIKRQAAQLKDKQEQIEILEIIIENQEKDFSEPVQQEPQYLGNFTVTHYCPCFKCCGKEDGITATGTPAKEGRTVAVDPKVIPLGSTVLIDGIEYIAEDIGGAIKGSRIDMFMSTHNAALQAGIVQADVYIER